MILQKKRLVTTTKKTIATLTSPSSIASISTSTPTTALALAGTTTTRSSEPLAEEDARYIFRKARAFAFQDEQQQQQQRRPNSNNDDFAITTDVGEDDYDLHYHSLGDEKNQIKEAQFWLDEIVHLQSGCVTGTLVDHDMCEDQDGVAEIVAKLRFKVRKHEQRLENTKNTRSDSAVPMIATELSVGALVVIVAVFLLTLDVVENHGNDVGPIENYQQFINILHEKGYFVSMMDHFTQHLNFNA